MSEQRNICGVCCLDIKLVDTPQGPKWLHDDPSYDPWASPIHVPAPEAVEDE